MPNNSLSQQVIKEIINACMQELLQTGATIQKNKGLVKFQIIQYASICEALLDWTLKSFHPKYFA